MTFAPITQRFEYDCAVCCLAMFLGVEYDAIVRHSTGYELTLSGLTNDREKFIAGLFDVEIKFRDRGRIDWARPAVLTLPSLNAARLGTHTVYWDGKRAYDPNDGRPGKKAYSNQQARELAIDGYQLAQGAAGDARPESLAPG